MFDMRNTKAEILEGALKLYGQLADALVEIERLKAAQDWQPIETAPRDGRFILIFVPKGQLETGPVTIGTYWKEIGRDGRGRFSKGHWDRASWNGWQGMDADTAPSWCEPTYWMPLPEPPK